MSKSNNSKAKDKWRGLLPKINRINKNLSNFQKIYPEDDKRAGLVDWSHAYHVLENYATSGDKTLFFNTDLKSSKFSVGIRSFKEFEKMTEGKQTEFKDMIDRASEYKTLTMRGAASRREKAFKSFKDNRQRVVKDINPDTGKVSYYKRAKLSRDEFDNFWKVYNNWTDKDKDKYGSAMIEMMRNELNLGAMSKDDIETILDYAYNEGIEQTDIFKKDISDISISSLGLDQELLNKYYLF